jgi:hypothetical protein
MGYRVSSSFCTFADLRPPRLTRPRGLGRQAAVYAWMTIHMSCALSGQRPHGLTEPDAIASSPRAWAMEASDPQEAFDAAFLLANDLGLAKTRLREAGVDNPDFHLRMAILEIQGTDHTQAEDHLLELIRHWPEHNNAYVGLLLLHELMPRTSDRARALVPALQRALSGRNLSGSKRSLATALLREFTASADGDDLPSGWISMFRTIGPVGPITAYRMPPFPKSFDSLLSPGGDAHTLDLDRNVALPDGFAFDILQGGQEGVYLAETYVNVGPGDFGQSVIEAHFPGQGRLLIDDTEVLHRTTLPRFKAKALRAQVRLGSGWHRIRLQLELSSPERASLHITTPDGRSLIRETSLTPRPVPQQGAVNPAPLDWSSELPKVDGGLFGLYVAIRSRLTPWLADAEGADRLLERYPQPESHAFALLKAHSMRLRGFPDTLIEQTLRQATPTPEAILRLAELLAIARPHESLALLRGLPKDDSPCSIGTPAALLAFLQLDMHIAIYRRLARAADCPSVLPLYRTLQPYLEARGEYGLLAELKKSHDRWRIPAENADPSKPPIPNVDASESFVGLDARHEFSRSWSPRRAEQAIRMYLSEGSFLRARALADRTIASGHRGPSLIRLLAQTYASTGSGTDAQAVYQWLFDRGVSTIGDEIARARRSGLPLEPPKPDTWLSEALAWTLPKEAPRRGQEGDAETFGSEIDRERILDRQVFDIGKTGRARALSHQVTRLLSHAAVSEQGEFTVPEDSIAIQLRTIKPSGEVDGVDAFAEKPEISVRTLGVGDVFEHQFVSLRPPATPWGGFFFEKVLMESASATKRRDIALVAPPSLTIWSQNRNGAPLPLLHRDGEDQVLLFRVDEVAPVPVDPYAPPPEDWLPTVALSAGLSREQANLANGIRALPMHEGSPSLDQAAENILRKCPQRDPGKRAQVQCLFQWTLSQIRPGAELRPQISLAARAGNRTGVLFALLRSAGIPAQLTLMRTGHYVPLQLDVPDPNRFATLALRIPLSDNVVWSGFSSNDAFLGQLPAEFAGAYFIGVEPSGVSRIFAVNQEEVAHAQFYARAELRFDASGAFVGTLHLSMPRQIGGEYLRSISGVAADALLTQATSWLNTLELDAQVRSLEHRLSSDSLGIDMEISLVSPIEKSGSLPHVRTPFSRPPSLHFLGLPSLQDYSHESNRTVPLALPSRREVWEVLIAWPKETEPPSSEHLGAFQTQQPWHSLSTETSWNASSRTLRVRREESTQRVLVEVPTYRNFRTAARLAIEKQQRATRPVTFKP